jgi:type IV secretory pathway protease TraF
MRSGIGNAAIDPLFVANAADSSGNPLGSSANPSFSSSSPSASAAAGISRVQTPVAASSLVVKASPGNLYGYTAVSGASAGYVMLFDAVAAPADGTVTPKGVIVLAANSSIVVDRSTPIRFTTGIVMVFSTTGPFTKTASATAFLAGDAA